MNDNMMEESKAVDERRHNFTIIDNEVIERTAEIGIYALGVYSVLVKMANAGNKCFPGQRYIAAMLGISERKVRDSIESLEKAHLITVTHNYGFPSTYHITCVKKKGTPAQNAALPRHDMPDPPAPRAGLPRHHVPPNNINITIPNQQEGPPGEAQTTLHLQAYINPFNQIVSILRTPDLPPTAYRLGMLKSAFSNVNIGGFENIKKAARNLMASDFPDSYKRYDWLFNKFDFVEHITELLIKKHDVTPKARRYGEVPADWRPEDASRTATP
ncbi:MAG TPA: helix-turn-helix domain-containing protein [bacterium]|nr:helix-turn-helix domain-containing protein [bacterium]HQJ66274.1 helix-turn-helix domain-containing protein [bacterium]